MSTFKRFGLFRKFRPALPNVSPRGATNWEGFPNSGPKLRGLPPGEGKPLAMSGYEAAIPSPLETPALSVSEIPVFPALLITVNGVPDWKIATPEISHP